MGSVSGLLTSSDNAPHFRPLLFILDDVYFFEAIRDYAQVLRQADSLFEFEMLFLTDVVAHVEAHNEPTDEDPDPEPLLDDLELETVSAWLTEAEVRATQLRRPKEHGPQVVMPPKPHTTAANTSPPKSQSNNAKRGTKPVRLPTESPPSRPAKRTRTISRAKSPPTEMGASSPPEGIAHRHSKENRAIPAHSTHVTPSKPRPPVCTKELKLERPVTPPPRRRTSLTRTTVFAGHSQALKRQYVQEMEECTSDSEPDPLDLFASSPPRVRHPTRR